MSEMTYELWNRSRSAWCNYEIDDARWHVDAIRKLLPDRWNGEGTELTGSFRLLAEPRTAEAQSWAVAIQYGGRTVGHLAADDAAEWVDVLGRLLASDLIPTTPGRIFAWETGRWGDPDPDGELTREIGVRMQLKLAEPSHALPLNQPPIGDYTLVPRGSRVKVTRTNEHSMVLLPLVPSAGSGLMIATLHDLTGHSGGKLTPRPAVEVRIDGDRIGQLTPQMSQSFAPMIHHLEARGLVTACIAEITGSSVAAEVKIDAIKAHEAPDHVLHGDPIRVPPVVPSSALLVPVDTDHLPRHLIAPMQFGPPRPVVESVLFVEPDDHAVVRFQIGRHGYYSHAAIRNHGRWETTADNVHPDFEDLDWKPASETEDWITLCGKGTHVQVATVWAPISARDPRISHHRSVIRFDLAGVRVVAIAINPSIEHDYPSWHYTVTEALRSHLDDRLSEALTGRHEYWQHGMNLQIATRWKNLLPAATLS